MAMPDKETLSPAFGVCGIHRTAAYQASVLKVRYRAGRSAVGSDDTDSGQYPGPEHNQRIPRPVAPFCGSAGRKTGEKRKIVG
jgi:hypothetical protein